MQRIQAGNYWDYEEETFCFGAAPRGRRITVVIRTEEDGRKSASFGFGGYDVSSYPCRECSDGEIPEDCPERNEELLRLILDLLRQSGADQEENYKALLRQIGD